MCFDWVHNRAVQNQFAIGWGPSVKNLGDYFTKHHTPARYKGICNIHIYIIRKGVLILQYIPARQPVNMQKQP
jgi:hypothetical protein